VPVRLEVADAEIPSTPSLRSAFWMNSNIPCQAHTGSNPCAASGELQAMYSRLALDNRITVAQPYAGSPGGANRARFDAHVRPLLDGTTASPLVGARLTTLLLFPWCDVACLAQWRAVADETGFADRVVYLPCDEPGGSASSWGTCRQNAVNAEAVWPGVRQAVTSTIQDASANQAAESLDVLVPLVNHIDDKPGRRYSGNQRPVYDSWLTAKPSREIWLYSTCFSHGCGPEPPAPTCSVNDDRSAYWDGWGPSYVIDQPASQARAMGWLAFEYDASGELYFDTVNRLATAWDDQYCFGGHGDGTLFYPGTVARVGGTRDIPIESIRMKRIRDGYEDYELLRLAAEAGEGDAARDVARGLFPTSYESTTTQSAVDQARADLFALIV
jgi:hypothetical protein